MASITLTASFVGGAALSGQSLAASRRKLIVTSSATNGTSKGEKVQARCDSEAGCSSGRRDLMFAAAAAAVSSAAGIALADEPKPGTPDAKKIYAPVCVTMPTARICHK